MEKKFRGAISEKDRLQKLAADQHLMARKAAGAADGQTLTYDYNGNLLAVLQPDQQLLNSVDIVPDFKIMQKIVTTLPAKDKAKEV